MPKPRKPRQHVNPLSATYASPRAQRVVIPAHLGPSPPIDVELGCADAQFSFELARACPDRLVVGLDIRAPMIDRGLRQPELAELPNLLLSYCNMNVDLDRVFPSATVDRFHILFPDPWFKHKHRKRRVVEPGLLEVIHDQLRNGGELHFASDVFDIALEALFQIETEGEHLFENMAGPWRFWRANPYGARSRREDITIARGQRVWRTRWRRR